MRYSAQQRFLPRPVLFLIVAALLFVASLVWQVVRQPVVVNVPSQQLTTADLVTKLENRIEQEGTTAVSYAELGLAYLQQVRETGDATYYNLAQQAFDEALAREPQQFQALLGQGVLALARHDFQQALVWGEQARIQNRFSAEALGVLVDAYVELGEYEMAVSTAQEMVNLRPGLASYSRVSYIRELYGDVDGAIAAMEQAVAAGVPGQENRLWAEVQLGNLHFNRGDWDSAAQVYEQALRAQADYPFAVAGMGRVQAARGEWETAVLTYEELVARMPLPEFVIVLGELYEVGGQLDKAEEQYALVNVIQQLNAAGGMDVDLELALFEADHAFDPETTLAKAQASYERRPSIYAADVLAWAYYHAGDYALAQQYSEESRRLGTQDAELYFHASEIAAALGDEAGAEELLKTAVSINPVFSILSPQAGNNGT